jgi:CheY-like chemotaxis protein
MDRKLRILHIDDEPWDVEFLRDFLEREGFEVVIAAWPDIHSFPDLESYDAILLDCILPPGNFTFHETDEGYTTGLVIHQRIIKKHAPNVPVMMLTALPGGSKLFAKVRAYAQEENIVFFEKPASSIDVANALKRAIKDHPKGNG